METGGPPQPGNTASARASILMVFGYPSWQRFAHSVRSPKIYDFVGKSGHLDPCECRPKGNKAEYVALIRTLFKCVLYRQFITSRVSVGFADMNLPMKNSPPSCPFVSLL